MLLRQSSMVLEPCQPDRVFLLVWLALALAFLQAAQPGLVEAPQPGQAAQPVVEAGQAGLLLALVEGLLLALVEVQPEYGWVLGLQEAGQPGLVPGRVVVLLLPCLLLLVLVVLAKRRRTGQPAGLATWLWQVHQSPVVDPLVAALLQAAGVASVLPAFAAAALLAVAGAAASAGSAGPHSFSPPRPP